MELFVEAAGCLASSRLSFAQGLMKRIVASSTAATTSTMLQNARCGRLFSSGLICRPFNFSVFIESYGCGISDRFQGGDDRQARRADGRQQAADDADDHGENHSLRREPRRDA